MEIIATYPNGSVRVSIEGKYKDLDLKVLLENPETLADKIISEKVGVGKTTSHLFRDGVIFGINAIIEEIKNSPNG